MFFIWYNKEQTCDNVLYKVHREKDIGGYMEKYGPNEYKCCLTFSIISFIIFCCYKYINIIAPNWLLMNFAGLLLLFLIPGCFVFGLFSLFEIGHSIANFLAKVKYKKLASITYIIAGSLAMMGVGICFLMLFVMAPWFFAVMFLLWLLFW